MTDTETQTVIAATEDALIQSLPIRLPISRRVDLVNQIRREVARVLKQDAA